MDSRVTEKEWTVNWIQFETEKKHNFEVISTVKPRGNWFQSWYLCTVAAMMRMS